jgi:PAS domain S-box-containing protein
MQQYSSNPLFDYSSMGIVIVDSSSHITMANPFALRLFGYADGELNGLSIHTLIPTRFHARHEKHEQKFYSEPCHRPMGVAMDLVGIKKDGFEFPVEVSLASYEEKGELRVISFISDITTRKKNEEEIRQLNAELEEKVRQRTDALAHTILQLKKQVKETEATEKELMQIQQELKKALENEKELSELKSRFVSMASHEFRTPLSTILSSSYLMQRYVTTEHQPKREKHIERIVSSVNTLTDILNDFLSVGRIEEGKINAHCVHLNVKSNIESTINELKTIQKKGQNIYYKHTGNEHGYFDPSLLKHVMMNLISNAVKFSPENAAIYITSSGQTDQFEISIKDQGVGISKEDQEHLFERFFRGANVLNIQGTGLGLHIVSRYVELMNGTVKCHSELNKGTEFLISFKNINNN